MNQLCCCSCIGVVGVVVVSFLCSLRTTLLGFYLNLYLRISVEWVPKLLGILLSWNLLFTGKYFCTNMIFYSTEHGTQSWFVVRLLSFRHSPGLLLNFKRKDIECFDFSSFRGREPKWIFLRAQSSEWFALFLWVLDGCRTGHESGSLRPCSRLYLYICVYKVSLPLSISLFILAMESNLFLTGCRLFFFCSPSRCASAMERSKRIFESRFNIHLIYFYITKTNKKHSSELLVYVP